MAETSAQHQIKPSKSVVMIGLMGAGKSRIGRELAALLGVPFVDADTEIVEAAGLPRDEAAGVLQTRSFKDAIDKDWEKSRSYGVTGVPTFVAGGYGVVGAQQYEALEQLMTQAGAVSTSQD